MSRKKTITIIAVVVLLAGIAIGVWLTTKAIAKNHAYAFLKDAVAAQPFSSALEAPAPAHRTAECYPSGKLKDYCPALEYNMTDQVCHTVIAALAKGSEDCSKSIGYRREYQGRNVSYILSVYDNRKTLTVYIGTN